MKKAISLLLFVLATGCTDVAPSSPSAVPPRRASTDTSGIGINTYKLRQLPPLRPLNEPDSPGLQKVPITRVFDADVIEKGKGGFVVQGTSGRKYLLIPTESLVTKPAGVTGNINFDQIKVKIKLTVRLSWKIPIVPVYVCEGVQLHGVKLDGVIDLTPPGVRRDDQPSK